MIKSIYLSSFEILKKLPFKLWGISLLSGALSLIVLILGVVPLVIIPVIAALNAGMIAVYYQVYNGKEADTKTLLAPFSDWKTFRRIAGGMCWQYLWIFLWALIPIAGPFVAIYKWISYSFTPYILNEEKSVRGIDAIKKSMLDTSDCKMNIFLAVILPYIAYGVVSFILSLLGLIPYVGIPFIIISYILSLAYSIVMPLFIGLVRSGIYDYYKKPAPTAATTTPKTVTPKVIAVPAPAEPQSKEQTETQTAAQAAASICPVCGKENSSDKKFCMKCGAKL